MKRTELWRTPLDLISRYRSALMGAAALFILLYHCWIRVNLQVWKLAELERNILSVGFIGVEMFLFLSGMGLTHAIEKHRNVWAFYGKRIRRIVFPFVFAGVLTAWDRGLSVGAFFLLISGVTHITESIQALLWYVPATMVLYLLFPLYHRLMIRSRNETAFVLNSIGLWLLLTLAIRGSVRSDLWVFINRVPTFLLGVLAGRLSRTRRVEFQRTHWWGVLIALVLGYQLTRLGVRGQFVLYPDMAYSLEAAMLGVALVLILSAGFERMEAFEGAVGKWMHRTVAALAYIGSFSLELYCIHLWLYEKIYACLEGKISYLQMNFVTLPACLLAAWLLFVIHKGFWKGADGVVRCLRKRKAE